MSRSLLLELGTEDLPARYVAPLADALTQGLAGGLGKRQVEVGAAHTYATPRRIAVLIEGVAERQPDQTIERLGPALAAALKDGQPTPAALGFAKSCGVEFSALGQKDGKLHFAKQSPGRPTAELIAEIFEETLKQMDELVPKRMRWGSGEETFVRPVQWILALFGEDIVPLRRFGLDSGRVTYGHRFHAPAAIELRSPADYVDALKKAHVWADVASRKAGIRAQIEAAAAKLGGSARITEDLLDEVTALVEWPVVIAGRIEERFLELPKEVIIATVETNQRYFTVFDAAGKLLPVFITISNIESRDPAQVIQGNERVVRPRLTDAMFFWEQDLKQPLAAYAPKLESTTYQKDLGSTAAKVLRVTALVADLARQLPCDAAAAVRAAQLCKADLVTKMVYEFPELQGLMGGYYASRSGESPTVATAIAEHYLPTQQGTPIPSTPEGRLVSLADKLDTLAGIFAIGQKPTASKDPFALRRAALGVLRILIEGGLDLDLDLLLRQALENQPTGKRDMTTRIELVDFVLERLRAYYLDQRLPIEMFEAVKALGITAPLDFNARLQALRGFWALPAAKSLAAAHKRIRNLLRQADNFIPQGLVDPMRFEHAVEHALWGTVQALEAEGRAKSDYVGRFTALAEHLQQPVDAFFNAVMVNADDPAVRNNRLLLLHHIDLACREIADISLLPG